MVQCDRPSKPKPRQRHVVFIVTLVWLGKLAGCAQPPPDPSVTQSFYQVVVRHIEENATYGFSEAEVYLTTLSRIPEAAVYEFGDRTCETLRRGGSIKQIADTIQAQFPRDDERMIYRHIAQAAGRNLCPESSFPAEGWRRSLFFWTERLNGGTPL